MMDTPRRKATSIIGMLVEVVTLDGCAPTSTIVRGTLLEISELGVLLRSEHDGSIIFSSSATLRAIGTSDDG